MKTEIVAIYKQNLADDSGVICFINPKPPSYSLNTKWLKEGFSESLPIKLLKARELKKPLDLSNTFPENLPGGRFRSETIVFIHCLYVYPNYHKNIENLLFPFSHCATFRQNHKLFIR
jgi:hypothetical protein